MNEEDFKDVIQSVLNCEPDEFYKKYKKMKKAEEEFNNLYEPFKKGLIELYANHSEMPKSIVVGGAKLTYVSPSTRTTVDTKKLKEEEPELAKKYSKTSLVSATIRLE